MEAVKPLAKAQGCAVLLSDEPVVIDGWHYIKAEVQLIDSETGEKVVATGNAREPESKKGMDASQITGTASSYARKYALSGLFALDDTKDADTLNNGGENRPTGNKAAAKKQNYCCADCGRPFVEFTDQQHNVWTPEKQYQAALKVSSDGKARCKACRER